jgi:hypothetical protein
MKTSGPSYRYLHLGLGILAIFLVMLGWGLIWVYDEFFSLDLVTIGWIAATLLLPIVLLIGGLGYARGREWGRRLVDILALVVYLIAALLAGGIFFVAAHLLSRTPPRAEVAAINPFLNWSFISFFLGILMVLIMLLAVLLRGMLWKPEVMLFFKAAAARAELRAKILLRMGLIGFVLLLASFALGWVWFIIQK